MDRIRIALADDHPTLLEGLITTLAPDFEIVGAYQNGNAVVEGVKESQPDLVIMDISMPLLSGLEAAGQIRVAAPNTKILFFTMHARPGYEAAAQKAGAHGMVLKSESREKLLCAIAKISAGSEYWPTASLKPARSESDEPGAESYSRQLTPRELEVLQTIAEGKSAKEIAYKLGISIWTVTYHRQQIKKKLGLATTADLTRFAMEQGLV